MCIGWDAGDTGDGEVKWRQLKAGFMHERNQKSTQTTVHVDWDGIADSQLQQHK